MLDKGDYISGSIYLKDNVTLHIEKDAALVGSLNPYDYVKDPDAEMDGAYPCREAGEHRSDGRGHLMAVASM